MSVTFVARSARLALHYGTKEVKVGPNKTVSEVAKIQFEAGRFTTSDPKLIQIVEESEEYQKRLIVKVDESKTKEQMAAIHGQNSKDPNAPKAKAGSGPLHTP